MFNLSTLFCWFCYIHAAATAASATKRPVYIMGILPYTCGVWDAGAVIELAADIALQTINNHPHVLTDYELKMVYEDGQCKVSLIIAK